VAYRGVTNLDRGLLLYVGGPRISKQVGAISLGLERPGTTMPYAFTAAITRAVGRKDALWERYREIDRSCIRSIARSRSGREPRPRCPDETEFVAGHRGLPVARQGTRLVEDRPREQSASPEVCPELRQRAGAPGAATNITTLTADSRSMPRLTAAVLVPAPSIDIERDLNGANQG
jgi:hypothetical protein